jgi:hypothetical protein
MAIFTVVVLAAIYVPGMLRGRLRAELAVLIVVFFCWLYRGIYSYDFYSYDLYSHYSTLGFILTYSLVFHRKAPVPPPYHLTLREVLLGNSSAERTRMIALLERNMTEEPDPEVRNAYAQSIASLKRELPPGSRVVE